MKQLIILVLCVLFTTHAYAALPHLVGYCGAYHLMLKHYDEVNELTRMTSDVGIMQHYARELVRRARTDPQGAYREGRFACQQLNFRT
jgi:hypothetical protein